MNKEEDIEIFKRVQDLMDTLEEDINAMNDHLRIVDRKFCKIKTSGFDIIYEIGKFLMNRVEDESH